MATNLINNLFKIGQLQGPNSTSGASKVDFGSNNKPNSIFNAAGMNGFNEDAVGDSFTRTTNKTEETNNQTENKTQNKEQNTAQDKAKNATNPNNAKGKAEAGSMGKNNAPTFGLTQGANNNSFGALSANKNEENTQDATEKTGFGSLAINTGTKYTVNNDDEIKELAEALGCEAEEDAVKNELSKMNAKDLAKLDGNLLDTAEELNLISMKDIEEKTGVSEKQLADADKKQDKKIKFGTMTSGDMV